MCDALYYESPNKRAINRIITYHLLFITHRFTYTAEYLPLNPSGPRTAMPRNSTRVGNSVMTRSGTSLRSWGRELVYVCVCVSVCE